MISPVDPAATLPPGLRIGCVRYLNSKPLIHRHAGRVVFHHPAVLADELAAGRLDVGLVPTFELLRRPDYRVVDDVAIASRGPVHSVFLVYRGKRLADAQTIRLDPASRTSVNLLRVLLAEFHGLTPHYEPLLPADLENDAPAHGEALLLIGDQAIAFRRQADAAGRTDLGFFDLGEQWQLATGLPFVFAAWLVRPQTPDAARIADTLRAWRDAGCRQMREVIAQAEADQDLPPGFAEFYLTRCIRYRLGEAEKRAIAEYGRLLCKYGLIAAAAPGELSWV